ncbi:MAG: hypothetical protein QE271_10315 [Bacteriovoracaceae bacterium]|nr:hypothetical protein [Bacteriovoracaceae bacterium]
MMKKNKALQLFSDEYLENCKKLTPKQILIFLDDFRRLHYETQLNLKLKSKSKSKSPSKLISIKVPVNLLAAFKAKSQLENTPYQTKMKELMQEWLRI